jgi:hypothetical protein
MLNVHYRHPRDLRPRKVLEVARSATSTGVHAGITLHNTFPNATGTRAVCLLEADNVNSVRDLVDSIVGQYSKNEYFEVSVDNAMGLPT